MIAALDVGGTNIRCNIIASDGSMVASESMSSHNVELVRTVESIVEKYKIEKVGISYAGQVDKGKIISAPNITVDRPDIQRYFFKKHNIELHIENDLKCAALAEYRHLHCSSTMVAASIGTGFGSAIIENGRLFRGSHNLAGEIGHIPHKYSEVPCGCGNHYCIEAFCSGSALSRWIEYYGLPVKEHTIQNLKELASAEADLILKNFHEAFLFSIGTIISLINPKVIVLGGGVVKKNRYLLEMANEDAYKYSLSISRKQVEIVMSELDNASIRGAQLLVDHSSWSNKG